MLDFLDSERLEGRHLDFCRVERAKPPVLWLMSHENSVEFLRELAERLVPQS